jgi:nucleoside-diphosphate-sugar epimerase
MKVLLTGCAGFIGSHTIDRLLADGHHVIGLDNFDLFYDRALKAAKIAAHEDHSGYELLEADLADVETYQKLKFMVGEEPIDAIIHLAVKTGVRPSIEDTVGYQRANVIATQNLLEFAKDESIKQFVFASSSSVYGDGSTRRDYTFIDDIIEGIIGSLHYQGSNYELINLGNDKTLTLSQMIETIEGVVGKEAIIERQIDQPGEIPQTWANIDKAREALNYSPTANIAEAILEQKANQIAH